MKFKVIDFKTKEEIERGSFKEEMFYDLTLYIITHYSTRKITIDFNKTDNSYIYLYIRKWDEK